MRLYFTRAALLATASLTALPAYAQDANDVIVVTATRTPTAIERLPADVDVIDVEDARGQGVLSLADALSATPGINVVQGGGFGQQSSLFSSGASSNHTLVLFDGIRLNDPSSPTSAFDAGQDTLGDIARVEVVQGPMSAVFGSDAIGGVINMIPRRGGDGAFNGRLEAFAGSFNTFAATVGVDGTLGRFAYAVTAENYATDGYDIVPERMITHTGDRDGARSSTITSVFDFEATDNLSFDLLLRHRQSSAEFDAFSYVGWDEYRVDDPNLENSKNNLSVGRLGATWRFSDSLSLRATGGSLAYDRAQRDDGATTSTYEGERRFADLMLDWRGENIGPFSNVALVGGVEAEAEEINAVSFSTISADQERTGAFATSQSDLGALSLTAAMRVDDFDGFGTQETWRVGAAYLIADMARIYANYGTSYRAPTLNERFDPSYGNPNLEAEEAQGYEVGASLWFGAFGQDRGLELGALYRATDVDSLITYASSPPYAFINIDEAELQSAEARVALRPLSWLTAQVSYTHTEATNGVTGARLARRPEEAWTASLSADHGPFRAQLTWRHVGEQLDRIYSNTGLFVGAGDLAAFETLRASVGWEFAEGREIFVAGANLTDEVYEIPGGFAGAPANVLFGIRIKP
jgi:vitamin B12 transporter